MNQQAVIDLVLQALLVSGKLAAPVLVTSLVVGFAISLFQSVTQIQEVTLSFVPKAVAVAADAHQGRLRARGKARRLARCRAPSDRDLHFRARGQQSHLEVRARRRREQQVHRTSALRGETRRGGECVGMNRRIRRKRVRRPRDVGAKCRRRQAREPRTETVERGHTRPKQ